MPRCLPPTAPLSALILPVWLFADPDVVSLEVADRPNFFLHSTANGSLQLAKWQGSNAFHLQASFVLHQGTWRAGLVALESLAQPGSFLYVSGRTLALQPYEHTEIFRQGTLFRLLGRCLCCYHPWPLSPSLNCHSCPLPTHPSSCPQETETLPSWHREVHGCHPGRGSYGQCGLGSSQLPGSCLLPQANDMV